MLPPIVINKRRAPTGWERDPEYVYIGRPSKWRNPWSHKPSKFTVYKVRSQQEAVDKYRNAILQGELAYLLNDLEELTGKTLVCFCKPKDCHGDVLIELWEERFG